MSDTAQSGGSNGFFSVIGDAFGKGVAKIGTDVLPRWAETKLGIQQKNQLNQDTINNRLLDPTLNDIKRQTSQVVSNAPMTAILLFALGIGLTIIIVKVKK